MYKECWHKLPLEPYGQYLIGLMPFFYHSDWMCTESEWQNLRGITMVYKGVFDVSHSMDYYTKYSTFWIGNEI